MCVCGVCVGGGGCGGCVCVCFFVLFCFDFLSLIWQNMKVDFFVFVLAKQS